MYIGWFVGSVVHHGSQSSQPDRALALPAPRPLPRRAPHLRGTPHPRPARAYRRPSESFECTPGKNIRDFALLSLTFLVTGTR